MRRNMYKSLHVMQSFKTVFMLYRVNVCSFFSYEVAIVCI